MLDAVRGWLCCCDDTGAAVTGRSFDDYGSIVIDEGAEGTNDKNTPCLDVEVFVGANAVVSGCFSVLSFVFVILKLTNAAKLGNDRIVGYVAGGVIFCLSVTNLVVSILACRKISRLQDSNGALQDEVQTRCSNNSGRKSTISLIQTIPAVRRSSSPSLGKKTESPRPFSFTEVPASESQRHDAKGGRPPLSPPPPKHISSERRFTSGDFLPHTEGGSPSSE